jgi:hypothetical protein
MALIRRNERSLAVGRFRLRVWAGVFVVCFVLAMIVAMAGG